MTYDEQLKDSRWLAKRERILSRDFGMCQQCMSSKNLNIHHKYYINGKMAWDYPDCALTTLCNNCHKVEHSIDDEPEDELSALMKKMYGFVGDWMRLAESEIKKKNG